MLKHLPPGRQNEALAGDLLEEFVHGRSAIWYWRQVMVAIVIRCYRDILNHRTILTYAAVWSILAPSWFVISDKMWANSQLLGPIYRMDFPWSTICDLIFVSGLSLVFIWTGLLLYLVPHMLAMRSFNIGRLGRGLSLTLLVWAALLVLSFLLPPPMHSLDRRDFTPLNAIKNMQIWVGCLPAILTLVCGLWGATSRRMRAHSKFAIQS
jgi:hypothetical protein